MGEIEAGQGFESRFADEQIEAQTNFLKVSHRSSLSLRIQRSWAVLPTREGIRGAKTRKGRPERRGYWAVICSSGSHASLPQSLWLPFGKSMTRLRVLPDRVYDELNCVTPPPPHSYIEALNPNATLFGDRAFREVIKVKRDVRSLFLSLTSLTLDELLLWAPCGEAHKGRNRGLLPTVVSVNHRGVDPSTAVRPSDAVIPGHRLTATSWRTLK